MNSLVITGLGPVIHVPGFVTASKTWMAGTSARSKASSSRPAMTEMMASPGMTENIASS